MSKRTSKDANRQKNPATKVVGAAVKLVLGTAAALLAVEGLLTLLESLSGHLNVCVGMVLVMGIGGVCIYRDTRRSLDAGGRVLTLTVPVRGTAVRPSAARVKTAAYRQQMPASRPRWRGSRAS